MDTAQNPDYLRRFARKEKTPEGRPEYLETAIAARNDRIRELEGAIVAWHKWSMDDDLSDAPCDQLHALAETLK